MMTAEDFKCRFLPLHPKLYRIAFALVGNADDAEDILQETYSKLWMKREELEAVRNPEAFCVTWVKNCCLDYLRSPRANRHEEDITEAYARGLFPGKECRGERENPEYPKVDATAPGKTTTGVEITKFRGLLDGGNRRDYRSECRKYPHLAFPGTKDVKGTIL